ncbi:DUF4197 domain-containing protein [Varunaivibrio sulfuroxidans]|uniref:Uncharacterized protein DUF4197 n=1 Tax=Varunaivibrio sulfuroxidans TaxID=1773489 RepID=A0A4R3JG91_9PROT|nr:DUF4197 domain-containing protein [Varunaivibrio sulfuroxidans]TCS65169.1 uncharacterized protein DUF4197 [Varunaivibrio sulfuroxidans]WES29549.1 DUF4197 domain-containing protein [Varunaivibrio sulfuroxidans]
MDVWNRRIGRFLVLWGVAMILSGAPFQRAATGSGLFDRAKGLLDGMGVGGAGAGKILPGDASALTTQDIARGLREALKVGTARATVKTGALDGFNGNPAIHIPLPQSLGRVQKALRTVGMSGLADDLELRLNRAAEAAMKPAKAVFWKAIGEMTLDDVQKIYKGPKDAATQYFKAKMSGDLRVQMKPIVDRNLSKVGALRAYDEMMGRYRTIPFVPDVKADLSDYVVKKGLDGLFHVVAQEEAAIRENPVARTTDILKRVFGAP